MHIGAMQARGLVGKFAMEETEMELSVEIEEEEKRKKAARQRFDESRRERLEMLKIRSAEGEQKMQATPSLQPGSPEASREVARPPSDPAEGSRPAGVQVPPRMQPTEGLQKQGTGLSAMGSSTEKTALHPEAALRGNLQEGGERLEPLAAARSASTPGFGGVVPQAPGVRVPPRKRPTGVLKQARTGPLEAY